MPEVTHVFDALPAYALGSLEEAEARQVAEHLASCHVCREELAAFRGVAEQLALGAVEAEPPELKERLLERARRQHALGAADARPYSWRQRLLPAWGLASLVLILLLMLSNVWVLQRLNVLERRARPLDMRAVALNATGDAPNASGYVLITADGLNGTVVVDKLPQLDAAHTYQLWLARPGEFASGALFTVDDTGYRGARIEAPDSLLTYVSVQVTIEPAGGSTAPTGATVLNADLTGS